MTKIPTIVGLFTVVAVGGGVSRAGAQTQTDPPEYFANVNGGAQPQQRVFATSSQFRIYNENATIAMQGHVPRGLVVDGNVGWISAELNVGAALGFSSFVKKDSVAVTGSIPSPIVFNSLKTTTIALTGMRHIERAGYIQFLYRVPVGTSKSDVTLGVGPTVIKVTQDVASASASSVPLRTQDFLPSIETQSKNVLGLVASVDFSYMFTRTLGGGLFFRYAGAKADLPSIPALKIGGIQAGLGIRIRL